MLICIFGLHWICGIQLRVCGFTSWFACALDLPSQIICLSRPYGNVHDNGHAGYLCISIYAFLLHILFNARLSCIFLYVFSMHQLYAVCKVAGICILLLLIMIYLDVLF